MTGQLQQAVSAGPLLLAVPLAALAGLVSFLSPCVLPLVPCFLGYVTGLTGEDLARQRRGRLLAGSLLFVLGFSAVFVLVNFTVGSLGYALQAHSVLLQRLLGAVVVALGVVVLASPLWAQRELKVRWRPRAGLLGAPLLGVVFGLGWGPCIGPVFAAIVALGWQSGTAARATGLAVAYCLGLGLPFVLVALGYGRGMRALGVLRRHTRAVNAFGGALLVLIGALLVTDGFNEIMGWLRGPTANFETVI